MHGRKKAVVPPSAERRAELAKKAANYAKLSAHALKAKAAGVRDEKTFGIVERLLCASALRPLGLSFLQRIASSAFPTNLPFALEIVLTAAVSEGGLPASWDGFFDPLPLDQLSVRHAARLLHAINEAMPLPPSYFASAIAFARRALLSSPHMSSGVTRFSATGGSCGRAARSLSLSVSARTSCGECGREPVTNGQPKSGPANTAENGVAEV